MTIAERISIESQPLKAKKIEDRRLVDEVPPPPLPRLAHQPVQPFQTRVGNRGRRARVGTARCPVKGSSDGTERGSALEWYLPGDDAKREAAAQAFATLEAKLVELLNDANANRALLKKWDRASRDRLSRMHDSGRAAAALEQIYRRALS